MATDVQQILDNLLWFYDFNGKVVVSVGAGGGQLVEYSRGAKKVIAVDHDPGAIISLKESLKARGLEKKFKLIEGDFDELDLKGDVVLFEFCLHEMPDPGRSLERAGAMAPEVVIIDHFPGSEWAYFAAEEDKVEVTWNAVERLGAKKRVSFEAVQHFRDYQELLSKVEQQGDLSILRIQQFVDGKDIAIRMPYGIVVV